MEVLYQLSYEGGGAKRSGSRRNACDARLAGRSLAEWRGQDSNLRRLSQRIYSPSPLTAREPRQGPGESSDVSTIASVRSPAPGPGPVRPRGANWSAGGQLAVQRRAAFSTSTFFANGSGASNRNADRVPCTLVLIRQVLVIGRELRTVVRHAQLPASGLVAGIRIHDEAEPALPIVPDVAACVAADGVFEPLLGLPRTIVVELVRPSRRHTR